MELKVFKDTIASYGGRWETRLELPVETEILIPDYLPAVFKIVKCLITPVVLQNRVSGGRWQSEGYLRCTVYYQSEEPGTRLLRTEQKFAFEKLVELPAGQYADGPAQVWGEPEYCNCRAVSEHRIDLRGAYILCAAVAVRRESELLTALADCGIEQYTRTMQGLQCAVTEEKTLTAETAAALPGTGESVLDITGSFAAGRTIMTTEPKFIPEKAVKLELSGGGSFKARLIDCVGYMVDGALGHEENEAPRLVKSPWFDHEVPFDLAAETGTRCVIREHATVGLVVTTDGSVADLPREAYLDAERRIIAELDGIGKPYIILLNCAEPDSDDAQRLAAELAETYGHAVLPLNCTTMTVETLDKLLQTLLYEFPIREIAVQMPAWVTMLESGHWLQSAVYTSMLDFAASVHRMADLAGKRPQLGCEYITAASLTGMDLASGSVSITAAVAPDIFYKILGEQTGLDIVDEASLLPCVVSLARAKRAYDKIKSALDQVEATGYGIVMPGIDELTLEEPEIVRQGGQYGVRLSASAPSLHIMRANIHTELSPTVGSEQQGEELIKSLLADFETDPGKLWSTNIFGKSLNELVSEGVQAKLLHMPQEARSRLQQTLERIINEGCDGLICILL